MGLNHFDNKGNAVMVDVSDKDITERIATAEGKIKMNNTAMEAVVNGTSKKGDVLNVARVAGIMAAKKTFEIIPMCHLLMLTKCSVDFEVKKNYVVAKCTVKTKGKTGVEMEALTGVNVALLTIYDMLKAVDRSMEITDIRIRKINTDSRLKAVASITIDNCFAIHELRVIEGKEGLFVAMPSRQVSDGTFKDIAHPINAETRKLIEDFVVAKYQEEC